MAGHTDLVMVGGGCAGVIAANRTTQRGDVTVTLINPHPNFATGPPASVGGAAAPQRRRRPGDPGERRSAEG